MTFNAGDACTGDVVMFEQNVYEMYVLENSVHSKVFGSAKWYHWL